jgi:hypothetical protein
VADLVLKQQGLSRASRRPAVSNCTRWRDALAALRSREDACRYQVIANREIDLLRGMGARRAAGLATSFGAGSLSDMPASLDRLRRATKRCRASTDADVAWLGEATARTLDNRAAGEPAPLDQALGLGWSELLGYRDRLLREAHYPG